MISDIRKNHIRFISTRGDLTIKINFFHQNFFNFISSLNININLIDELCKRDETSESDSKFTPVVLTATELINLDIWDLDAYQITLPIFNNTSHYSTSTNF